MEHEDEEGTDEQGWEERKIPGHEVRLACIQVSFKRTSADDKTLTAQKPAVRRGSFHERRRAMCLPNAAIPTICEEE